MADGLITQDEYATARASILREQLSSFLTSYNIAKLYWTPPVCGKTKIAEHLGEINTKINTTMNTLGFEYPSDFFGQNHFLPHPVAGHVTIMMVSQVNYFLTQQSHIICSNSDPKP